MRQRFRLSLLALLLLLPVLSGCGTSDTASTSNQDSLLALAQEDPPQGSLSPTQSYDHEPGSSRPRRSGSGSATAAGNRITVPSGTPIHATVNAEISSKTANAGDRWSGQVTESVVVGGRTVIPAGSIVSGTVTAARAAERGDRAMIDLAVTSVSVDGRSYPMHASTEAIVAGSTRARNLGAIAGSAAAGAIIGKTVGGSGKGAVIGGLLGGAAAGGVVAKSKGYQVVLKSGTELTFTTNESVAVRL